MDMNRKKAFDILVDMEKNKSYSNIAINRFLKDNKADNPAFVRELVYGVLENKIYLDYAIDCYLKTPITKLKAIPLVLLRMGFYQLEFMDGVPPYAAINESVILAKKQLRGREGFINGVLRAFDRNREKVVLPDRTQNLVRFLSVKYSYEEWIARYWISTYGEKFTEQLMEWGNKTPPLTIRPNLLTMNREKLKKALVEKGFQVEESRRSPLGLHLKGGKALEDDLFQQGHFSVQDESSMLAILELNPKPGELVIDVCAAPGGKTFLMAELMKNQGRIISCDVHPHKLQLIQKNAGRLGLSNVHTRLQDGITPEPSFFGKADCVLVDAPCSGLGVIRRKPEIKYGGAYEMLEDLATMQLKLLRESSRYVKKFGTLMYSTCTLTKMENQGVKEKFIKENPDFRLVTEKHLFPNIDGTDGFYFCKFEKSE